MAVGPGGEASRFLPLDARVGTSDHGHVASAGAVAGRGGALASAVDSGAVPSRQGGTPCVLWTVCRPIPAYRIT
eukprot:10652-Prymnesium_polylepis.1